MSMNKIMATLRSFEITPECAGLNLRLDLATILCVKLKERGWSMNRLAKKTGLKESFLGRVACSNVNVSFDVAGRILHALGTDAELTPLAKGKKRNTWLHRRAKASDGRK